MVGRVNADGGLSYRYIASCVQPGPGAKMLDADRRYGERPRDPRSARTAALRQTRGALSQAATLLTEPVTTTGGSSTRSRSDTALFNSQYQGPSSHHQSYWGPSSQQESYPG